ACNAHRSATLHHLVSRQRLHNRSFTAPSGVASNGNKSSASPFFHALGITTVALKMQIAHSNNKAVLVGSQSSKSVCHGGGWLINLWNGTGTGRRGEELCDYKQPPGNKR